MKQDDIKVSVIVPIYRVEKYLSKCIESIQQQEHKNLEIILIDDGSDDSSGMIADQYAKSDERIKAIHKKNGGVSTARNAGLDKASGEYVCFVDGDDFVMPDYVSYLLGLIVVNNADISITTAMLGNFDETQKTDTGIQIFNSVKSTEFMLCYRFPIGVYCRMFKKEFLDEQHIRFRTELFIGEGFNFNMDAIQRADKIVVGQRKVYYYRRDNETSAMTAFSTEKWENGLYALQVIKNNLIIKSDEINKAWKYAWWRTNSDAYDSIVIADAKKSNHEMYRDCRSVVRKEGFIALKVPASKKDKIRAVVMTIWPPAIPFMLKIRRRKYLRR